MYGTSKQLYQKANSTQTYGRKTSGHNTESLEEVETQLNGSATVGQGRRLIK